MGYASLHPSYAADSAPGLTHCVGWVEAPLGAVTHHGSAMGRLRIGEASVMGCASLYPSYAADSAPGLMQGVGWVEAPLGAGTHHGSVMGRRSAGDGLRFAPPILRG